MCFQDMLLLSCAVASHYYNRCKDDSTNSRKYGWHWYLSFNNGSGRAIKQAAGRQLPIPPAWVQSQFRLWEFVMGRVKLW
jgi:hypothetical protein